MRVRLSRSGATRAARATGHGTNGGSNSNPMHSKPPSPRGEGRAGGSAHGPISARDATGSGSLRAWATGPGTPKDRDELRRPGTTHLALAPSMHSKGMRYPLQGETRARGVRITCSRTNRTGGCPSDRCGVWKDQSLGDLDEDPRGSQHPDASLCNSKFITSPWRGGRSHEQAKTSGQAQVKTIDTQPRSIPQPLHGERNSFML